MSFINGCGGIQVSAQAKTHTPTKDQQILTPDSDHNAFSQFTLNALPLQLETITNNGIFLPDDGYAGFSAATISATKNAALSISVPNTVTTVGTDPSNFELQIPMGEHLVLPTTIIMHAVGTLYKSNNVSYTRYRFLTNAIWTINETGDGYIGTLYGAQYDSGNKYDEMSPPVINVPGTIYNNDSAITLSFTAQGTNSDITTSGSKPTISFTGLDYENKRLTFDIISIWN